MKYYLNTGKALVGSFSPAQLGKMIRELRQFGYTNAAETFERLRKGVRNHKPYDCTEQEIQCIRIARGATALSKQLLGESIGPSKKLTMNRHFKPPVARKPRLAAGCVECPHCGEQFDPS